MNSKVNLRPEDRELVLALIAAFLPEATVCAFGSRVTGNAKPNSDLDLCVMDQLDEPFAVDRLRAAFSESRLPMKVDIVEWERLDDEFRQVIKSRCMKMWSPTTVQSRARMAGR